MSAAPTSGASPGLAGPAIAQDSSAAVTMLVLHERQSRDRARWEEMLDCYTDDASIAMSWFTGPAATFVHRSQSMDVGGSRGVHRLSPPVVRVQGGRALAEVPLVIEFRTDVGGVEADLCSFARSQYRAVRTAGGWRISALTAVYERDTLTPAVPGTGLPVPAGAMDGLRSSYRCLAWHLARSGYPVPGDLPGDDRPETVEAVSAADLRWLHGDTSTTSGLATSREPRGRTSETARTPITEERTP